MLDGSKMIAPIASLTSVPLAFKMVFLNPVYIAIAAAVFTIFWIIFNIFDQLLFFSPVFTFYLPEDTVTGFIITNITSVLMGILVMLFYGFLFLSSFLDSLNECINTIRYPTRWTDKIRPFWNIIFFFLVFHTSR